MIIPRYEIKYRNRNFLASSKEEMIQNISTYFSKKNEVIDIEMVKIHVNKNIKENPSSKPDSGEGLDKVHKPKLTFKEALAGSVALLKVVGGDTVSKEEIKRRSALCASCPLKTEVSNCWGCGFGKTLTRFISGLRNMFTGEVSLSRDVSSSYCGVCGCALATMLPSKMSSFNQESQEKQKERPNYCWVKQNSPNYVTD